MSFALRFQHEGPGSMGLLLNLAVVLVFAIVLMAIPLMMNADREIDAAHERQRLAYEMRIDRPNGHVRVHKLPERLGTLHAVPRVAMKSSTTAAPRDTHPTEPTRRAA